MKLDIHKTLSQIEYMEKFCDGAFVWGSSTGQVSLGPKLSNRLQISEVEQKNFNLSKMIPSADIKMFYSAIQETLLQEGTDSKEFDIEMRIKVSEERVYHMRVRGAAIKEQDQFLFTLVDIGKTRGNDKDSHIKIGKNTNLMFDIIENLPYMIFLKDAKELKFKLFNKAGSELLGIERSEIIDKSDFDFFPHDQARTFQKMDRDVINSGEMVVIAEEPIKASGGVRWLRTKKITLYNNNGEPEYLLGMSEDITELKKKTDDIKESEKKFQDQKYFLKNTVDKLPAIFYAKDLEGRFLLVNQALRELLELEDKDFMGKSNHDIFPKEMADLFRENDLEAAKKGRVIESEEKASDANGNIRYFHSFKFPYFDNQNNVFATGGISLDVTDKKEFERQAFHNAKLASIGEIAAGVGHEINNPLTIARGYILKSLGRLAKEDFNLILHRQDLEKAGIAIDRIAKIVQGLRTFAGNQKDQNEVFDIWKAIGESVSLVKEIYENDGISIELKSDLLPESRLMVLGNYGKIQQVVMNFITNARDATALIEKRMIVINVGANKEEIYFTVKDNGAGMPKELQQRIFDPFFTTKEINKGTGIGLSLVYTIVKEHKGIVSVQSELQKGSEFKVVLPRHKKSMIF